jgi:hypothetical protein
MFMNLQASVCTDAGIDVHTDPSDSAHSDKAQGRAWFDGLGRYHSRRLREIYRSAGWPFQDTVELELIAAGLLELVFESGCQDRVRLTPLGIAYVAQCIEKNRLNRSAHEVLVNRIAQSMLHDGRVVWTNLSLRAKLAAEPEAKPRWKICKPDVFSIRNTSVAGYLEPIVHEIKVSRADLLGDLKRKDKRDSYIDVGGQCWYVLGCNAKGRPIGTEDEVPLECGVLIAEPDHLHVARNAAKRSTPELPFAIWMALAKATPVTASGFESEFGAPQSVLQNV